jgi:hypothetical protein
MFTKLTRRLFILPILAILISATLAPNLALQAASPKVTLTFAPGSTCSPTANVAKYTYLGQNIPAGSKWFGTARLNGTLIWDDGPYFNLANGGPGVTQIGMSYASQSLPYTLVYVFTYYTNTDTFFGGTIMTLQCDLGNIATVTIQNFDPEGPGRKPLFDDGRVNDNDALQTAAIYCDVPEAGAIRIYALYDNVGYVALTATKAEIDAVPVKPATNTLIKSGLGAFLYRLTTGKLQVNRGDYTFIWDGC